MFYQLSQKFSKGTTIAITIPTIIAVSYSVFGFFRYTGTYVRVYVVSVASSRSVAATACRTDDVCCIRTGPELGGAVPGSPKTTSAEWQAASVEYGKAQKANPIRHFKD